MLKIYVIDGRTFQYEEGGQPDGAVEYKPEEKTKKNPAPADKARRTVKNK
jgi:hypothetical protein